MKLSNNFNVGIIGTGVGYFHFKSLEKLSSCKKIKVYDINDRNYLKIKKSKKAIFAKNEDEIFKDSTIGLVIIASYDNYHFKQIIKSFKNKKFVFCEKPICQTKKELTVIRSYLKKNKNLFISSNFVLRNHPTFRELEKKIKKNEFGNIFHIHGEYNYGRIEKIINGWRGSIPYYSVMQGGGIHLIDLALYLKKELPIEVFAMSNNISTKKSDLKFPDFIKATFKYRDGCILSITANFGCVMPHNHKLSVYGTKKTFEYDFNKSKIFKSRNIKNNPTLLKKNFLNKDKSYLLLNFIDFLKKKSNQIISSTEIFKSMDLCFSIHESFKKKRLVKVFYNND